MVKNSLNKLSLCLLIIFSLCFCRCNDKDNVKLPWSMEKTVDIFTEVQLIEAKLATNDDFNLKCSLSNVYYQELFIKFNTNQEGLTEVFSYYMRHPQKMEDIYSEVVTRLTLL